MEEHKDCWDKAYGCCKICGDFIAKEALKYKNSNGSLPKVQTMQQIQTENPFLDNAIKSLANAIEFTEKKDDRYLQAALIEMDAAAESFLKAKLFKDNPAEFMKCDWEHLTYEKAISKVEQTTPIPEAMFLKAAHSERNKAQHRAVIANFLWTIHHLNNIYKFARRFCSEQFNLDLEQILKDIYHIDYIPKKNDK